jgi:hypothetical protein
MADSWQKFLYEKHQAFAVGPFTSESSVQLLDVLVKTKGSNPILYNVGSMVNLGSKEFPIIADRLREVLQHLLSNEGKDSCDFVRGCCKSHRLFFSQLGLSTIAAEETEIVHCCDDLLLPCLNFIIRFFGLSMWADDMT